MRITLRQAFFLHGILVVLSHGSFQDFRFGNFYLCLARRSFMLRNEPKI